MSDAKDLRGLRLLTESSLRSLPSGATVWIAPQAIVTPLARDAARDRQLSIQRRGADSGPPSPGTPHSLEAGLLAQEGDRVAVACDHGAFSAKGPILEVLRELGFVPQDLGCHSTESVDYPDLAERASVLVAAKVVAAGIIMDGAGIGSCMVANKVPGVRAAMAYDLSSARNAREHNCANVLTLGARLVGPGLLEDIVRTFFGTPFAGGRHAARVAKINRVDERMGRSA